MSPADRAATAARRFDALSSDVGGDQISAAPATVGDLRGVLVAAGNYVLFGIAEGDIDPILGETMSEVSGRAVAALRAVADARAEQRRPMTILRGIALSLGAAVLLLLVRGRSGGRWIARCSDSRRRPIGGRPCWSGWTSGAPCTPSSAGW